MPELHLNYMCLAPRKHPEPDPPVNGCRKEVNTNPQEIHETIYRLFFLNFISSPLPLSSISEAWILAWVRSCCATRVHHLPELLAFQRESLFPAPTTHPLMSWPVVWQGV